MPAARYWRIVAIDTYAGGDLELSELHLYGAEGRLDTAATISSSIAPTAGSLAALQDDDPSSTCRFAGDTVRAGGFALVWDFGAGNVANATGLRLGAADVQDTFLAGCAMQYRSDGTWWTTLASFDRAVYPGALGAVSVLRVDADFGKVTLRLPLDGPNASTLIADYSDSRIPATAKGGAVISTAQSRFGGSSAYFNGSTDWLSAPDVAAFGFGLADFTLEAWIYVTGGGGTDRGIFDFRRLGGFDIASFFIDGPSGGKLAFWYGTKLGASGMTLSVNTWYHVALTRKEGVFRCFVDGTLDWTATASVDFGATRPLGVGGVVIPDFPTVVSSPFHGYIDDLRITKGEARYDATFTAPTAALPAAFFSGTSAPPLKASGVTSAFCAARSSVPPHSALSAPPLLLARDTEFGGDGTVYGTTEIKGTPDAPLRARVRLIRERDGLVYREMWSDGVTGAYRFDGVDELETYTVLTYHPTRDRRAVVADGIIPEVSA